MFCFILFAVCVFALAHTYVLFPLWVKWAARGKHNNTITYEAQSEDLPQVAILMSCYNEEKVISRKLQNSLSLTYPADKLVLYIGSDCSSDATHDLIQQFMSAYPERQIHFFPFSERRGKPAVINDLALQASKADLFILTDADVMLEPNTVFELAKHFKQANIGLVDSNLQNLNREAGVGATEGVYMNREASVKHDEGKAWGLTLGPSGGCYAIRAAWFSPVPQGYLVDDFYIALRILERGAWAISEPAALCYEQSPSHIGDEFKRKTRIAAGNFKNLETFYHLLSPTRGRLAYVFWSHKVLRWIGPFLFLLALMAAAILAFVQGSLYFQIIFGLMLGGLLGSPLLDAVLNLMGIKNHLLRALTYFIAMNAALLKGFFKYLRGVKTGVWQPTKRS